MKRFVLLTLLVISRLASLFSPTDRKPEFFPCFSSETVINGITLTGVTSTLSLESCYKATCGSLQVRFPNTIRFTSLAHVLASIMQRYLTDELANLSASYSDRNASFAIDFGYTPSEASGWRRQFNFGEFLPNPRRFLVTVIWALPI